jgi:type IX secretion system PorP/SprF family membrane protein
MSYLKSLNSYGDHFISFGIASGIVQNRLDITKAKVFDQDPYFSNPDFQNQVTYYDLSVGLAWFVPLRKGNFAYLGGSAFHVNRAFVSFNRDEELAEKGSNLIPRYVIHGGASFQINEFATLKPSFIFLDQGPHREINLGTFIKITRETRTYLRPEYAFHAGMWYRWSIKDGEFNRDALIATLRYDFRNTVFSVSFDLNISPLAKASRGYGGPELSIMHYFDFFRPVRKRSKVKCPEI